MSSTGYEDVLVENVTAVNGNDAEAASVTDLRRAADAAKAASLKAII